MRGTRKTLSLTSVKDFNEEKNKINLSENPRYCSGWIFDKATLASANESCQKFKQDNIGGSGWI